MTEGQVIRGAYIGLKRQAHNIFHGAREKYGALPEQDWQCHVEGALGELAVALFFGIEWSGNLRDYAAKDVGPLQVRSTSYDRGHLILHPPDNACDVFILVAGLNGRYRLAGWLVGRDGKQERYQDHPKARNRSDYWIPQSVLRPISEIDKTSLYEFQKKGIYGGR